MEQFEKIFFKYNCLNKRNNLKVNLDEIEAIIKFHLPNDYKIFLQNYLKKNSTY